MVGSTLEDGMADDKMKLPRSSYEELRKIIKAYSKLTKPSNNDELAKLTGIGRTHVSANNAFLLAVDIIQGASQKSPTLKGKELGLALEHEIHEETMRAWRKVVEENDFLSKMVQAIGVRKGMEESQLENHIAYSAGETKSREVMTGARTVIDILRDSGLVRQEGDRILPNPASQVLIPLDQDQSISHKQATGEEDSISQESGDLSIKRASLEKKGVSVHIEVRINATPDDLDGLGERLKKLINDIS
jgi:hypothetical protein